MFELVSAGKTKYRMPLMPEKSKVSGETCTATSGDSIKIGNGEKSYPRIILEKSAKAVVGVVLAVVSAVSGFVSGGVAGLTGKGGTDSPSMGAHNFTSAAIISSCSLVAGITLIGGGLGFILGATIGLGIGIQLYETGAYEGISSKVSESSIKSVADNIPSENKIKDGFRNFTEGSLVGAVKGASEGIDAGGKYGEEFVSGVIEGLKDAFS